MASNLNDFVGVQSARVYIEGGHEVDAQSIEVTVTGNHNQVNTLHAGFAGQSKGAPQVSINCDFAAKLSGFSPDVSEDVIEMTAREVALIIGAKSMTVEGYFNDFSASVGNSGESGVKFSFIGLPVAFE